MSYAARASSRRSQQPAGPVDGKTGPADARSLSRPATHSRKHSANTAGDVFAMLGQPVGSRAPVAKDKDKLHSPAIKEEQASEPALDGTDAKEVASPAHDPSSPSSSSPSTPSSSLPVGANSSTKPIYTHGRPSRERYKALYSKPDLLKLWASHLSVDIELLDLYSAFETPEQQNLQIEGAQHRTQNHRGNQGTGEQYSGQGYDRGARRERDPLARMSSGGTAMPSTAPYLPTARRTSSGAGNFGASGNLSGGFQGGVLSGVAGAGSTRRADPAGATNASDAFQRAPVSARRAGFADRDKEPLKQPAPTSAGLSGWSSNRWRHLQADEDSHISSSGSSAKDETEEPDLWSRPQSAGDSEWRPGQHDPIQAEKQALQNSQRDSRVNDAPDREEWLKARMGTRAGDAHAAAGSSQSALPSDKPDEQYSRSQLPSSTSNTSLFFDDLLGPTRLAQPSAVHPSSVSSSRSNSIAHSMSSLAIGQDSLSASTRSRPGSSMTPTRAAAAEGLEVLARRSPVQEFSMAALQQQRSPYSPAMHGVSAYARPPPPPHPTTEPHDRVFWQYRDPQGQVQGPFPALQMQDWYGQGFFNDTLLVKRVESPDYETLGALIIRLHDVHLPFMSAPVPQPIYAGPPGMGGPGQAGQAGFGLGHPPYQRIASPSTWQQQSPYATQPQQQQQSFNQPEPHHDSRSASYSAGNAVYDLFTKAQMRRSQSPEVTLSPAAHSPAPAQQQRAQPQGAPASATTPHDPWADMTPSAAQPALLPRGSSALGGEPVGPESAAFRRSTSGHHLPSIGTQILRQESVPSPIGRSTSSAAIRDAAIANDSQAPGSSKPSSPVKPKAVELPPVTKASEQAAAPSSAAKTTAAAPTPAVQSALKPIPQSSQPTKESSAREPAKSTAKISPPKSEATPSVPSVQATPAAPPASKPSTATPAPAAAPSGSKGTVDVVTQEAFDKQKKGPTAAAPTEVPLSSLAPSASQTDLASAASRKAAPWAKPVEDAAKSGEPGMVRSNSGLSLREIQAKEGKEAEIRRAQEKKQHAAQLAIQEALLAEKRAKEAAEGLPTNARWGDSAAASPVNPPTASPWTKPAAPAAATAKGGAKAKKTLKEIQEEEEAQARKKAAAQAQASAGQPSIAAGKGYATSIAGRNIAPSSDPSWTTVGAPKPAAPAPVASAARPISAGIPAAPPARLPASTASSTSLAAKLNGPPSRSSTPAPTPVTMTIVPNGRPAPAKPAKEEELAVPASAELLRWCKEALKGLDIPIDDFIQMLLSFPVPLDKSTRELVSDSVYASSRTLDGRHFSDAFADKRLADTKAIKQGRATPISLSSFFNSTSGGTVSSKQGTMADAIKFIPAQKQPELNFKVVTKAKGKKK